MFWNLRQSKRLENWGGKWEKSEKSRKLLHTVKLSSSWLKIRIDFLGAEYSRATKNKMKKKVKNLNFSTIHNLSNVLNSNSVSKAHFESRKFITTKLIVQIWQYVWKSILVTCLNLNKKTRRRRLFSILVKFHHRVEDNRIRMSS